MKSLYAKRIAAVAASLLVGLASAGQGVTYGNIPIISTTGQPVVQIVVGSTAQPSDGVVAANIAAVIGSLAHTTQNVTASISGPGGASVNNSYGVTCAITQSLCSISNQQVWLGEKGGVAAAGSFSFAGLIGSIINGGVINSANLGNTKYSSTTATQANVGSSFIYPDVGGSGPFTISTSPTPPSAWEGVGLPGSTPSASSTSGGVTLGKFTQGTGSNAKDNVVQFTSSQIPGLLNAYGTNLESESLWLAGYPVYDQQSNVTSFALLNVNGAYQVTFGKPISNLTGGSTTLQAFQFLGQNWSTYAFKPPVLTSNWPTSSQFVVGGNMTFASASTALTHVNVGGNLTTGNITVQLNDLEQLGSNQPDATFTVYKNGVATNTSVIVYSGHTVPVNSSGTLIHISMPQAFAGLYGNARYADVQLFSNILNVSNGGYWNTNNKNWLVELRWTSNQSSMPANQLVFSKDAQLQSIILYSNQSTTTMLTPGSTFDYIQNPAVWKLTFAGDTLGAPSSGNSNFDALSLSTSSSTASSSTGGSAYTNIGGNSMYPVTARVFNGLTFAAAGSTPAVNDSTVQEPVNLFTVTSQIPTAFTIVPSGALAAPSTSLQSVNYNLDSYKFTPYNAVQANTLVNATDPNAGLVIQLINNGVSGNYISNNNNFNVYLTGYNGNGQKQSGTALEATYNSFYGDTAAPFNGGNVVIYENGKTLLANLTGITLQYALPNPGVNVNVFESANVPANGISSSAGNEILLGSLTYNGPKLFYKPASYGYYVAPVATNSTVTYSGESNNVNFKIQQNSPANTVARGSYFTYNIPELISSSATTTEAATFIDLTNSTSAQQPNPLYLLNYTNGYNNAVDYASSSDYLLNPGNPEGSGVKALTGFRTERGSAVGAIPQGSGTLTYYMAKSVGGLEFLVGPANTNITTSTSLYGPYSVGATTNLPNVTIAKVNATCQFVSTTNTCTITGANKLVATPSVTQASVATVIDPTKGVPIAVLDTQANNASSEIVIGSKYVNSVAAQIFSANPSLNSAFAPTGPDSVIVQSYQNKILVAGYTAQQTVQAGNEFITNLLADAGA